MSSEKEEKDYEEKGTYKKFTYDYGMYFDHSYKWDCTMGT